jgi:hypothetical protein
MRLNQLGLASMKFEPISVTNNPRFEIADAAAGQSFADRPARNGNEKEREKKAGAAPRPRAGSSRRYGSE